MDVQQYGEYQLRLITTLGDDKMDMVHMAMGIGGESGEVVDVVKKHVAYGKPLDRAHLIEELGDLLFYMNGLIWMLDSSWDEVMGTNIRKLEARYPKGAFDASNAINRDKDAEQAAMQGTLAL